MSRLWTLRCVDDPPRKPRLPGAAGGRIRGLPMQPELLVEPSTTWFVDRPLAMSYRPTLVHGDAAASSHRRQPWTREHLRMGTRNSWPDIFLHRNPTFRPCGAEEGPSRPSTRGVASRAPLRCEGSAVDARGGRGALHPPSLSSTAHRPVSVLVRVFPPSPSEGGPCPSPRKIRHASQSFPSTPLLLVAICFSFPLPAERARPTFEPDSFRVCSFQASPIEPGSCPGQTTVSVPSQPLVTRALVLISIVSRRSKPRTRGLQGDTTDVGSGS